MVADWRGFHLALRCAALAATQSGAPLSLLMLELAVARCQQSDPDPVPRRIDRLAGAIAAALRHGNILARYAEQRFAVIMMETDLGAAVSCAERIGRSLSSCGFSGLAPSGIGVAQFRDDEALGQLIERAAEALGRARSAESLIAVACDRVRRPRRDPWSAMRSGMDAMDGAPGAASASRR